jgi:hypothetical protein
MLPTSLKDILDRTLYFAELSYNDRQNDTLIWMLHHFNILQAQVFTDLYNVIIKKISSKDNSHVLIPVLNKYTKFPNRNDGFDKIG